MLPQCNLNLPSLQSRLVRPSPACLGRGQLRARKQGYDLPSAALESGNSLGTFLWTQPQYWMKSLDPRVQDLDVGLFFCRSKCWVGVSHVENPKSPITSTA